MDHWIFAGRVEHSMHAANHDEMDAPALSVIERCRRQVVDYYAAGEGRRKTCVFAVTFRALREPGLNVLQISRGCQDEPNGPTCLRTRKRVQNAVDRLVRNKLVILDDKGGVHATSSGERFVLDGVKARAINLKALRLSMAEVCELCEDEELPTRTSSELQGERGYSIGGELTRNLPEVLKAWY